MCIHLQLYRYLYLYLSLYICIHMYIYGFHEPCLMNLLGNDLQPTKMNRETIPSGLVGDRRKIQGPAEVTPA